jgi:Ser/Thr protein kinase RdoA (MazF antagonist)
VLVFPWTEGKPRAFHEPDPSAARAMGAVFAKLHALDLQSRDMDEPDYAANDRATWARRLDRGRVAQLDWASAARLDELESWSDLFRAAGEALRGSVVSHRDLDPKNVLWADDAPALIDWEAVGRIHPALEVVTAALDWSAHGRSREAFEALLSGYRAESPAGLDSARAALPATLGGALGWLDYNMQRSAGDTGAPPAEIELATREVETTLVKLRAAAAGMEDWADWL